VRDERCPALLAQLDQAHEVARGFRNLLGAARTKGPFQGHRLPESWDVQTSPRGKVRGEAAQCGFVGQTHPRDDFGVA
jgi:hypothetical protein